MAEYLSEEDMNTGEYISRDEALMNLYFDCKSDFEYTKGKTDEKLYLK